MREFLSAPPDATGRTPRAAEKELDANRLQLIKNSLEPLLQSYLSGQTPLANFKSQVDSLNKKYEYWGFKGIKGQMFFNMLANTADDENELDAELKSAIAIPANEDIARSRIKTFLSYVKRLGESHVSGGGSLHGRPKSGSIPFFLSYFWQIQNPRIWPVYYTNTVNVLVDLNLWQPSDELAEDYVQFKHLHEELADIFTADSGEEFNLYDVEHVFWVKGGNAWGIDPTVDTKSISINNANVGDKGVENVTPQLPEKVKASLDAQQRLPESFVPPIVGILAEMAYHRPGLDDAAKASGTSLAKAFEKSVHAAFTLLGYETKLLGQGQGRVPDGLAIDHDGAYAILWDAKIRADGYSMGTDDRVIREYVTSQSRDLKKKRSLRNIYYVIVSSTFADDFDDLVRGLKMETHISEVCLVEAEALVSMVETKLRDPLHVTLGPDGLQRLFSVSGIIRAEHVLQTFA